MSPFLHAAIPVPAMLALFIVCTAANAAEPRQPSMTDSFAAARELANEGRQIEKRLSAIEASLKGIDASLKPVGMAAQPEAISRLTHEAVDHAMNRLTWLLLIATVCVAGLMVVGAFCWRWVNQRPPKR